VEDTLRISTVSPPKVVTTLCISTVSPPKVVYPGCNRGVHASHGGYGGGTVLWYMPPMGVSLGWYIPGYASQGGYP